MRYFVSGGLSVSQATTSLYILYILSFPLAAFVLDSATLIWPRINPNNGYLKLLWRHVTLSRNITYPAPLSGHLPIY